MPVKRVTLVFVLALAALLLTVGAAAMAQSAQGDSREPTSALRVVWTFQGKVFESPFPDESQPIPGVTVQLYGSNNPAPDGGQFMRETATEPNGWYALTVTGDDPTWEFFHVREVDPPGYISVTATSVSGTVVNPNWIEFQPGLLPFDTVFSGNKFWDQLSPEVGWLEGHVLDALSGGALPTCSPAEVQVEPEGLVLPADPATGHYGPAMLPSGDHMAIASAPGYVPGSALVPILGGATTVHDFYLDRPKIAVRPDNFVSVTAPISQPTTYPLTITNEGTAPLAFELVEDPTGADVPWMWEDPVTGTVPAPGVVVVDVTFHCTEVGDYPAVLQVLHSDPCVEPVNLPVLLHCQPAPERWKKWVNGEPWQPGLVVRTQTSDTIVVVDEVTAGEPFVLLETWNPNHLELIDVWVAPPTGMPPMIEPGQLVWEVIDPLPVMTITKWFHVQPCTWTETVLLEELSLADGFPEQRPVIVNELPPELWIESLYDPQVHAGEEVTFTLAYSNTGGYETAVVITNTFPGVAPLLRAAPPPDAAAPDGTWARWELGDLTQGAGGRIEVSVGIDPGLPPSTTLAIWDGIFDHVGGLADETLIEFHVEAPPLEWEKWVNGEQWSPQLTVRAETSDTIEVVDIVRYAGGPFQLVEEWDAGRLTLLGVMVEPPPLVPPQEEPGRLVVEVLEPIPEVMITKLFHVEPCTWTRTILEERLAFPEQGAVVRPVVIHKVPPELRIHSRYAPHVYAGAVATFTLAYSNTGGYETGVMITNTFPAVAPFVRSTPPPTDAAADGSWARWEVGDLAGGDRRTIDVIVGIDPTLPPSTTLRVWDGIYNHLGDLVGETVIEYHVEPQPIEWDKMVQGLPWRPELVITVQTSDTIVVVDAITLTQPVRLVERWNPEHLTLQDWAIDLPGVSPIVEVGEIIWELPPMPGVRATITKWFHVEPCTWERTVLEELLYVGAAADPVVRPVLVHKLPPKLWIDGVGPAGVVSGTPASFGLDYGNDGGREFGATIRNQFPREARFRASTPPPDRADPNGRWAEWDLPPLEMEQRDRITVTVDIAHHLVPSSTIEIWDGIYNHAGDVADETVIRLHVEPPPVTFPGGDWPWYAEGEISVYPYPAQAGRPTEVCVELVNPSPDPQTATVRFSWAAFGIGLPFSPIDGPRVVHVPPHSTVVECIHWVPPVSGHLCLQVELYVDGYPRQWSQRNLDVDEPLRPLTAHSLVFPVGNPLPKPVTITLGLIPHRPGWGVEIYPDVLPSVPAGETRPVTLTVTAPAVMPPDGEVIVDVEAYALGDLIGGFRKVFRPPVPLHRFPDPVYAEREISVQPYPPLAGEPTEICVELVNPTADPQDVVVRFSWANFGVGLPFTPINGPRPVHLPPHSVVNECIVWVPPVSGHLCLQVELLMDDYQPQRSQRNIDVDEPLLPDTPHSRRIRVGNPFQEPVTLTVKATPRAPGWGIDVQPPLLPNVPPGAVRAITLTVTPPSQLPPDGTALLDVEVYADHRLIGGFRKVFRPPILVHRPHEPVYAESEIYVQPYPPRALEPTEVGAELRNITYQPYTVTVQFSVAGFGIGLPFVPIHRPIQVVIPPYGRVRPSTVWIPPTAGQWCFRVEVRVPGYEQVFSSQRNIDIDEPLRPGVPHSRVFPVGNPYHRPVTVTLGLIPHLPDWGLELSSDVLANLLPGETRPVTLTVTPPGELPPDGRPIVDVEGFVDGKLIGGFRKIYRPPVPVHRPRDPVYAESEIGVDPYPAVAGVPTVLSVELHNPTAQDRVVTATFSIAPFGIGLPFSTTHIAPNPIQIFVPRFGAATGQVVWVPPRWPGKFCVRVTLEIPGHEPIWSQRNIDVGEPLRPGVPHSMLFPVGNPYTETVTVSLGLINYRHGWGASLSDEELENLLPGQTVTVTLTVTPSRDARLGTGMPIVDVEGYVDGVIIGGFRKLDRPPIPVHKPHERPYAETEILIDPYPPRVGEPAHVGAALQNGSPVSWTVGLEFGWAQFGMGIPFTTTGMVPYTRSVTLGPYLTDTAWVTWTPQIDGKQCVIVNLSDPSGEYVPERSQRNVEVAKRPPCDVTKVFTFTVANDSDITATVEIGLITFNVPADWQVTVVPTSTLEIPPFDTAVVTVTLVIPCPGSGRDLDRQALIDRLQEDAGGIPTINAEGYIGGELVGGIQLQFAPYETVVAGFDAAPTEGVTPLTVAFTNTSTGDFDTVLWDLGDGVTSTLESPTHTFTVKGVYTVSLTVSGPGGSATQVRPNLITVHAPAKAAFSAQQTMGVAPFEADFVNQSTGDFDTCAWTFGDGGTSSECDDPSHVFLTGGVYTVTLLVSGPGGTDTQTLVEYITVYVPVQAGFTADPTAGPAPLPVTFANESTGDYTTCGWTFGDRGSSSLCVGVTHTYTAAGRYTVVLVVSGPGGTDTQTRVDYVTIFAPVHAAFSAQPTSGFAPLRVTFTNQSTGDYTTTSWWFGDSATSDDSDPIHIYTVGGVYTVTLTVSGPGGSSTHTREEYVTVRYGVYLPVVMRR